MRLLTIGLLFSLVNQVFANDKITKGSKASWVNYNEAETIDTKENSGSFYYLLLDYQENLKEETYYRHFSIKLLNSEGVQSFSDISIDFDPSYQKLIFHHLEIVRDGNKIEKLRESKISSFQRESGMERSLYDGSETAVINLTDVQQGDVIDYSYSIVGFNPIKKGNYSQSFYHEYSFPVNRIYNRVIENAEKELYLTLENKATEPIVETTKAGREFVWDIKADEFIIYDNNTPSWYDAQKNASLSTYNTWGEVAEWALPLYSDLAINKEINNILSSSNDKRQRVLDLIRNVQDEVRYLGFESGISAYKPNLPPKVFKQKYGDCKDKSLLLVSLLNNEGVEAYPVLVNTSLEKEVAKQQPSHAAFNHCIVYFKFEEKDFFIDPTISGQGGDLENMNVPSYGKGLIIKKGVSDLVEIEEPKPSSISIKEIITIDSIGKGGIVEIITEYTGLKADYFRNYFRSNLLETIQQSYLDYYSNLYPNITIKEMLSVIDTDRSTENRFVINESYYVNQIWEKDESNEGVVSLTVYPLVLESVIDYPKSSERTMPYSLGNLETFKQLTEVRLPEEWSVVKDEFEISSNAFNYKSNFYGIDNQVFHETNFELKKTILSAQETQEFHKNISEMKDHMTYYLTYDFEFDDSEISYLAVVFAMIIAMIMLLYSIKLYKNYNPQPTYGAENKSIGGWLILPAIGLCFSPFILTYNYFELGYFSLSTWSGVFNNFDDQSINLFLIYGVEFIVNTGLIIFSVLIVVLFLQRRTSIPILVSIFYIVSFVFPLIDYFIVGKVLEDFGQVSDNNETFKQVIKGLIAAIIWIPYFNMSERAKDTFCMVHPASIQKEIRGVD